MTTQSFSFAGHQTFPFRYSWPKKAIDAVVADPKAFSADDALVRLGVGKNMVVSIRHWALALGLLEEDPDVPNNRGRFLKPTTFGKAVFSNEGWDPFLEDPGTLWLLHWQLASTSGNATTWWFAFNCYPGVQFDRRDLQLRLAELIKQNSVPRVSDASLKRDVDCFTLTYSRSRRRQAADEDTLDCPLIELGLLRPVGSHDTYQLVREQHRSLPLFVFGYALASYITSRATDIATVSLDELAFLPGSPGRVFCLDEIGLLARLEQLEKTTQGALVYDETSGLKQVLVRKKLEPLTFLKTHYAGRLTNRGKR